MVRSSCFVELQKCCIYTGMKKITVAIIVILCLIAFRYYFSHPSNTNGPTPYNKNNQAKDTEQARLQAKAKEARQFARQKNYSTRICFLADMNMSSGKKRFFVYDLVADTVLTAGLVAHGSCNQNYLREGQFSNTPDCSCSSLGKYLVSYKYKGKFGDAFKLYGLDSTNSNAFNRFIVLHGYSCVPDYETYPQTICNSLGCPMVSYRFLNNLAAYIQQSPKPIVLWMFQ